MTPSSKVAQQFLSRRGNLLNGVFLQRRIQHSVFHISWRSSTRVEPKAVLSIEQLPEVDKLLLAIDSVEGVPPIISVLTPSIIDFWFVQGIEAFSSRDGFMSFS